MEKNYKHIIIAVVVAVAAWYVFSGNGPAGQTGFDAIKNTISSALTKQRAVSDKLDNIGTGLDESAGTAGSIGNSNNSAKEAIGAAKASISGSKDIIEDNRKRLAECQSIIDRMEKRTGQGNVETKAGK